MKVRINTTTRLNESGRLGAILFVAAPVFGAGVYGWFLYAMAHPFDITPFMPGLLSVLCGIGWLVGCVLLLIGREYQHQVDAASEDGADREKPLWS